LTTTGTTNLGDLTAVNVYYTGSTNIFSTGTLFGTSAPGAAFNITGTQTLVSGTNYFWVEYALNPPMTNGNTLAGTCTSITVDGTPYAPSVLLGGGRIVDVCAPSPGGVGVSGLTSWFIAGKGNYVDAGVTIAVNNDIVMQWNNQVTNANIPSITKNGAGDQYLAVVNSYYNFNDIIVFSGDNYIKSMPYNGVFNPTGGASVFGVASKAALAFTFTSTGTSSPCGANRCCVGYRGTVSNLVNNGFSYSSTTDASRANVIGIWGTPGSSHNNNINGFWSTGGSSIPISNIGTYTYNIGNFPGYNFTGRIAEIFTFNTDMTNNEVQRVQSYMAIKYGVTLGVNGTSMDYLASTSGVVWDQSANSVYAFDIAGVGRDDASGLSQLKSHSVNNTALVFDDIVTIANGSNFYSPSTFSSDREMLLWGHDGDPTVNTGVIVNYPTDNGEIIETIFQREWKSQESGNVGTVSLKFDMSSVVGAGAAVGTNDLANLRLLVDEDGDFSSGATSYAPSSFNNISDFAIFEHDFTPTSGNNMDQNNGFFFTLASTNFLTTPLPIEIISFEVENQDCSNLVKWSTASEVNSDYFVIERSYDALNWTEIGTVDAAGNSISQLDYLFRDSDLELNGTIYYRLSQFDFDGSRSDIGMQIVSVYCWENIAPLIYPNPASESLFVESNQIGIATLTDLNGRVLLTIELENGLTSIPVSELARGTYLIDIQLSNGKSYNEPFVKL
jgi:Secretion system C-terminal sorting domain/N-terminal domain of BNR-repeat neuraminidase